MTNERTLAPCRCGKVALEIVGAPILRGVCYCASCQEAGRRHRAASGVDADLAEDGGTDYVLYRKDRVRCIRGGDLLEDRRLKPDSPTRRMYARCCDTAMFVDFTKGHWLTVYRSRLPRRYAAGDHAGHDCGAARGRGFARRYGQLSGPFRKIYAEAARRVDGHGVQTTGRRGRAISALTVPDRL